MDAQRADIRMMQQLRGAKEEGQEMVVVQAPDAVRARGLKIVGAL